MKTFDHTASSPGNGLLSPDELRANTAAIGSELLWLNSLINVRLKELAGEINNPGTLKNELPEAPETGPYAELVRKLRLSEPERIMLLLALQPHFLPLLPGYSLSDDGQKEKLPVEFGFFRDPYSGNQFPTLQTALFISAGRDVHEWRNAELEIIFDGKLFHEQIIVLRDPDHRERLSNRLTQLIDLAPEYVDYLLHGQKPRPDFGRAFPASWVSTRLNWDQLVLNPLTVSEINDVMDWVKHGHDVLSRAQGKVNKSFPVLFYGPPGTGKSFTAKLIGKEYGRDVFRIDLSMIVSKYIGETEKNLAQLFDRAEGKDWILFFDEADALFGKRTGISDSKDKWANLEMSYLLQRMEEYEGLCILASNLRHNLDPALTRRFQAIIHFPFPKPDERALIWQKSIPPGFEYPDDISFEKLSRYELSGGSITNVIKGACVKAVKNGDYKLDIKDISRFISIEYAKDNRTPQRAQPVHNRLQ